MCPIQFSVRMEISNSTWHIKKFQDSHDDRKPSMCCNATKSQENRQKDWETTKSNALRERRWFGEREQNMSAITREI